MKAQCYKLLIIIFSILFCIDSTLKAQDFYRNYKSYLLNHTYRQNRLFKKSVEISIERLKLATDKFEKEEKHSFFTADTVFMVGFFGAETGDIEEVVWTKNASCYYSYAWPSDIKEGGKPKRVLTFSSDATGILGYFDIELRKIIEFGDTLGYHKYSNKHKVVDGEYVSPIRAIKKQGHWVFMPFKGNGWAIDYSNSFKTTNTPPVHLNEVINNLSRQYLHFNIDSASLADGNDTSKSKKQSSYPVILLNNKVISYQQLFQIEITKVTAINVQDKNSNTLGIPNGINRKFGVILITTRPPNL